MSDVLPQGQPPKAPSTITSSPHVTSTSTSSSSSTTSSSTTEQRPTTTTRPRHAEVPTKGLERWYVANSLDPLTDGALVGSGKLVIPDQSPAHAAPLEAVLDNGSKGLPRTALYSTAALPGPAAIHLCGKNRSCSTTERGSMLQMAESFNEWKRSDLTVAVVAVRASENTQPIVIGDGSINSHGLFFGWYGEDGFRFGVTGMKGKHTVHASVGEIGKTLQWELWIGSLATASAEDSGLALYRNGVLVAQNKDVRSPFEGGSAGAVMGGDRDDFDFYVGELLLYSRALETDERGQLEQYLKDRYKIP